MRFVYWKPVHDYAVLVDRLFGFCFPMGNNYLHFQIQIALILCVCATFRKRFLTWLDASSRICIKFFAEIMFQLYNEVSIGKIFV